VEQFGELRRVDRTHNEVPVIRHDAEREQTNRVAFEALAEQAQKLSIVV
jgi:hypothetical protein